MNLKILPLHTKLSKKGNSHFCSCTASDPHKNVPIYAHVQHGKLKGMLLTVDAVLAWFGMWSKSNILGTVNTDIPLYGYMNKIYEYSKKVNNTIYVICTFPYLNYSNMTLSYFKLYLQGFYLNMEAIKNVFHKGVLSH